jgi:hypothetical protein
MDLDRARRPQAQLFSVSYFLAVVEHCGCFSGNATTVAITNNDVHHRNSWLAERLKEQNHVG